MNKLLPIDGINIPKIDTNTKESKPPIKIPENLVRSTFVKCPIIAVEKNITAANANAVKTVATPKANGRTENVRPVTAEYTKNKILLCAGSIVCNPLPKAIQIPNCTNNIMILEKPLNANFIMKPPFIKLTYPA